MSEQSRGAERFDRHLGSSSGASQPRTVASTIFEELNAMTWETGSQRLSGSTRADSISAKSFHSSGSLKVSQSLRAGTVEFSGSASIGEDLWSRELKVSGSIRVGGRLVAGTAHASGSISTEGGVWVRDHLDVSGSLEAPTVEALQTFVLSGRLEAKKVTGGILRWQGGGKVEDVIAGSVNINFDPGRRKGILAHGSLFHSSTGLHIDRLIARESVLVDRCSIGSLRGSVVRIGPSAQVRRVEFTESCEIAPGGVSVEPPVRVSGTPPSDQRG